MKQRIKKVIDRLEQNIVVMAFDNLCYNDSGIITLLKADMFTETELAEIDLINAESVVDRIQEQINSLFQALKQAKEAEKTAKRNLDILRERPQ
jgi:septation ring formation regulator EzrA